MVTYDSCYKSYSDFCYVTTIAAATDTEWPIRIYILESARNCFEPPLEGFDCIYFLLQAAVKYTPMAHVISTNRGRYKIVQDVAESMEHVPKMLHYKNWN